MKRWDVYLSFLSEQNASDVRRQVLEACSDLPGLQIENVDISDDQEGQEEEEDVTAEEDVEEESK